MPKEQEHRSLAQQPAIEFPRDLASIFPAHLICSGPRVPFGFHKRLDASFSKRLQ